MDRDAASSRERTRTALWLLLGGGILTLGGLPFPVNGRYWDAADDAGRIAAIDGDRLQFAVAFGLAALGTIGVGIGLALLAPALASASSSPGRRRHAAALVAAWMGWIGALGGLVVLLHALLATPEFFVDSIMFDVAVVAGGIAVMLAMIIVGVLGWSAPPPKWATVVLVVGGPLGFIPEVQQIAVIVFAAASIITLARRASLDGTFVQPSLAEPSP